MVNLSTTYDTDLHKKVFVLKGEEGYARTTDVVASLVEFADTDNYITNARYGLKIQVLRNIDDSSIAVFDNDQLLKLNDGSTLENIPWYETMSQATCPSGCTWNDDGTMTIGLEMDDDDPTDAYLQTGLALNYDVEHNIVVRYLGNSSCLKSKSRTITKTIAFPSAFITKFTLEAVDSTANVYNHSQTPVIKGVLTDGEDNPLQGKTVKVYEDGVLVATNTTGNDGSYSYTTNGLANGLHTYRFVFDGVDNEFYACEKSIDISYGYDMTVTYDPIWLMGKGSIYVEATDYFENPVQVTVTTELHSGTVLTAVTGSDGKATLSNTATDYDTVTPLTVSTAYGDTSESFSPVIAVPETCTITNSSLETYKYARSNLGVKINVTATDTDGNSISVEGCKVSVTNTRDSTVTLDANGNATSYYEPNGVGDVTVTATFGNVSDSAVIEDYSYYWTTYYKNRSERNVWYASLTNYSNGYKLTSTDSSNNGYIQFYQDGAYTTMEFDVVSNSYTKVRLGTILISAVAGDHIKVIRDSTSTRYYVNNELVKEGASSSVGITLGVLSNYSQVLVFDNLKIKYS